MEGLEICEIKLSEINFENNYFRIDNDYFSKQQIILDNKIREFGFTKLFYLSEKITDFGAYSQMNIVEFANSGVLFLRNQDVIANQISTTDNVYISKETYDKLTLKLQEFDVVIPRVGTLGNAGVVEKKHMPCSANQNLAVLRLKPGISPYYISTVLTSDIGIKQINRCSTGNVQQWLNLEAISNLKIPNLSFTDRIENIVKKAHYFIEQSKNLYYKAETILLETIDLNNFKPSTDPINIKNFKDSFLTTGRLDSEYYQKKYEEIVNHIKAQKYDSLSNIVKIKKSIEPGSDVYSDEGIPFLRVADYNKYGINEPEKKLSYSFCKSNKDLIKDLKPKKETILFSKDGTLGLAYMLRKDEEMITSGAILHLNVKDKTRIIPEYLTLALNSILVQMQAERDSGGSIILHWRINEVENVIVPIIDYAKQQKIAELVEESFALKKHSEHLLDTAKRSVEIAIEQNEQNALEYIKSSIIENPNK